MRKCKNEIIIQSIRSFSFFLLPKPLFCLFPIQIINRQLQRSLWVWISELNLSYWLDIDYQDISVLF